MITKNYFSLRGYAAEKPQMLDFNTEKKVCTIRMATKYTAKKTGVEVTEWHYIKMWGKNAEIANKFIEKGSLISLEGTIKPVKFENKEGKTVYGMELVATVLDLLCRPSAAPAQEKPKRKRTAKKS